MKNVRCSLAGYSIDSVLHSEVNTLSESFAHQDTNGAQHASLHLSFQVDPRFVSNALQSNVSGPLHYRQQDRHIWFCQKPQHIQRLSLNSLCDANAAAGEVFLNNKCIDGSIRARPASYAISTWAITKELMPVHASCIALNGSSLILLGVGGSGKTTTALALAERGWDFLGDDLCFIGHQNNELQVFSLYRTTILTPTSLNRLQASEWPNLGVTHHGKQARRLPTHINVPTQARLSAMVWVSANKPNATNLATEATPLNRQQSLVPWQLAFAPTLQSHGPTASLLKHLAHCSNIVQGWKLGLTWDFDRIDRVLRHILNQDRPTQ